MLVRRRGLVSPLGARQLARRPLRYTRSALLLMLAVALGTFAFAHAATWTRSQADQATYQAAADARVVLSDYQELPAWALGPAYRAHARASRPRRPSGGRRSTSVGRSATASCWRSTRPPSGRSSTMPARRRDDDPAAMLRQLAERRPPSAVPWHCPASPVVSAIVVDSDLAVPPDAPPPEDGSGQPARSPSRPC